MLGINLRISLATVAVAAGLLAPAASANAGTPQSGLIAYNGHAGLGALGAGVTDGTSNTVLFGVHAGRGANDAPRIDLAGPFTPNNWL